MTVYVLPNLSKPDTAKIALQAVSTLLHCGCNVVMETQCQDACYSEQVLYDSPEKCCAAADVIITLGGDGTILHCALATLSCAKPILGVNVGRCGFLASCEPEQMPEKLTRVAKGDFLLDRRSLLQATVWDDGRTTEHLALNDVVISNGKLMRAVDYTILCDDIPVQNYRGDGVIVATPTGSTAYSMAAGGPILDANADAFVLTPKCPHSLQSTPMVFSSQRIVQILLGESDAREVFVSCDGHTPQPLHTGARIQVMISDKHVNLITFGRTDQFQAIDRKLRSR